MRFLWALADYAARNLVLVPLPALPVLGPPLADSGDGNSPLVRKFRSVRQAFYPKARMEILLAVYEGISERIVAAGWHTCIISDCKTIIESSILVQN